MIRALLLMTFLIPAYSAAQTFTDKKVDWFFVGKRFDAICLNEGANPLPLRKFNDIVVRDADKLTGKIQVLDEKDNLLYTIPGDLCYFEQKTKEPVARIEFLEAIHEIKCSYSIMSFNNADFRIMGRNAKFATAKKLSDGSVFVFSRKLCNHTQKLPRVEFIGNIPLPPQEDLEVGVEP